MNTGQKRTSRASPLWRTSFALTVATLIAMALGPEASAAVKTWDRGAGTNNWGTANNWNPNGVPVAGDSVVLDNSALAGSYTVAVNANTVSLSGLTIGYVGNLNTITLAITNRTVNVNSGTASLTILAGGQITQTGSTITISGDWTNSSGVAFNPAGGLVTFTGTGTITGPAVADPLVAGDVGDAFFDLNLAAAGKTSRLASHITCKDILGITGGILDVKIGDPDRTIKLTRNGDGLNVTVGSTVNNVELFVDGPGGATAKRISGITDFLHSVRIRWPATGSVTLDFNMTCKRDFIIEASSVVLGSRNGGSNTSHTIGNEFVCGRTGAATFTAVNGTTSSVAVTGSFDNSGSILGSSDPNFYNLTVADSGKAVTLGLSIGVTNNFTVNGGAYNGAFATTLKRQDANPFTVFAGSVITQGTIALAPVTGATAGYTLSGVNNTDQTNQLNHLTINPVDVADTITLGQSLSIAGDLTVTTGVLAVGANTLTINGNTSIAAARTLSASTGTIDANGTFTANNTGNVTFTGAGNLYLSGDAAPNLGRFTRSTSRVIYDLAGNQTVYDTTSQGAFYYYNLEANNGGAVASVGFAVTTLTIDNSLTISGSSIVDVNAAFDQTGQTVTFGATGTGRLILRGSVTSLGTFTAGNGTVQYTADTALTAPAVNYYDLEIGRTGGPANTVAVASVSPANLGNQLAITGPATARVTGAFDATGRTVTFGASGTGTLRMEGAFTSLGTFTPGNGTVDFAMGTGVTIPTLNYFSLTVSGGQTASIDFAVDQTRLGNGDVAGTSTLTIGGASTVEVNAPFDLSGAGNRSVTFTGAGSLLLGGTVGSLSAGTGSFTGFTGCTVTYDDTSAGQTVAPVAYYNLTIDKGAGATEAARTATASVAITDATGGTIQIPSGGTLQIAGASILTVSGGVSLSAGRTVTFTGSGRLDLPGGTAISLGATFNRGTGRVRYMNTGAGQTLADVRYYDLEIDNGGQTALLNFVTFPIAAGGSSNPENSLAVSGASVVDVNSSFDMTGRILTFGASGTGTLNLGAAVTSLGTCTIGQSTIVYDNAAGDQTVAVPSGGSYYKLTIDNANAVARTATAGGSFSVTSHLVVTASGANDSIFDVSGASVPVGGNATVPGELKIAGGTVDVAGTFDATGGKTTFTGSGTLELSGPVTGLGTFANGGASSTVIYNYPGADDVVEAVGYRNLTLNPGAARTLTAGGDFAVGRVLTVSSGKLSLPDGTDVTIGGDGGAGNDLIVSSGATLEIIGGPAADGDGNSSSITMADTTVFAISGTFRSNTGSVYPTVTSDNPGVTRFAFEVLSGGLVVINGLTLTSPYTSANRGLHLNPGALTAALSLAVITFNNPEVTGPFLNLELGAGGANISCGQLTFNGSPQYTVRTDGAWAGGQIYLSFYTNGGTTTENDHDAGQIPNPDPTNTIRWTVGTVWTGASSTAWNTPGNWSGGLVPDEDTDVSIPDVANDPVLDADGKCSGVFITTGTLTINLNYTLSVYGDFNNSGTLVMTNGRVVFRGDIPAVNPGGSPLYEMEVDKFGSGDVTLTQNLTITNTLTITNGPLNVSSITITVGSTGTGDLTIGPGGTLRIGTGRADVKGTFDSSGTVIFTDAGRLELGGPVTAFGGLTAGTGTVSYDGAGAQTVRTDGIAYNHLEIAKTGGSTATTDGAAGLVVGGNLRLISGNLTAASAFDIAGALTVESGAGTLSAGGFSHQVGGNFTHDGGTFTAGASTFTFDGGTTQTLGGSASTTFNAVTIPVGTTLLVSTSGPAATVTASGLLSIAGTLQLAANRTLTANGGVSGSGGITLLAGSGALLDANGDFNLTGPLSFAGDATLRLDGTVTSLTSTPFAATTGTIIFGNSAAQTIPTAGVTYFNLTVDKTSGATATASAAATLDVNGALAVQNAGNFAAGGALDVEGALTVSTSGSFTLGAQNLNLAGSFTHSAGTFTVSTGLVTLDGAAQSFGGAAATALDSFTVSGTGTKTINGSSVVTVGSNLTVNAALAVSSASLTVTGATSVNGTLSIGAGGLVDTNGSFGATGSVTFTGAGTLYLGGAVTGLGTFTGSTGTVRYDSASDQTVAAVSYYGLEIAKGASTGTAAGGFAVGGGLSVISGTLALGAGTVTVTGAVTISDGAILSFSSGGLDVGGAFTAGATGAVTITSSGTLTLRGSVASLGTFTAAGGSTVSYRSTAPGDQQVLVPAPSNYSNLTLNRSSGLTSTTAGALTLTGNLTVTAGTLDLAGAGISVTGNITTGANGTLKATGGTIHLDGTFDATGGTVNFGGGNARLELDGPVTSMGTLTGGSSMVVYQDTVTAQTLRPAAYANLTFSATGQTVTASTASPITASGTCDVTAGTLLLPGSSSLSVTGAMTVTGTGTLSLTGTATLQLGTSLSIGTATTAGGAFTTAVDSGTPTLTSTAGVFAFTVRNGGIVTLNGLGLSNVNGDGLHLMSDAAVSCDIDDVAFSTIATGAVTYGYTCFLNVRIATATAFSYSVCSFTAVNPLAAPPQFSVASAVGYTGALEMLSASGAGAGASYENDNESGMVNPGEITWPAYRTWTGATSTLWSVGTNWSPSGAPTSADNARIPTATRQPTLDVSSDCKSLLITTGTLTINNAARTLSVYGDLTVEAAGALNMQNAGVPTGTIALRGSATQNVDPGGVTLGDGQIANLVINKTGGTATLTTDTTVPQNLTMTAGTLDIASATLQVVGTLATSGGTGTLKIGTGTLDANGAINLTGGAYTCTGVGTTRASGTVTSLGTFTAGSGTFIYDGNASPQGILATGVIYYNLTIEKTAGTTAQVPDAATLNVSSDLTLSTGNLDGDAVPGTADTTLNVTRDLVLGASAGTYLVRNGAVNIGRDLTHTAGTFTAGGTSTFTFNGTTQVIGGAASTTFDNLTISVGSNTSIAAGLTITVSTGNTLTNNGTLTFAAATNHVLDVNGPFTAGGGSSIFFTTGGELRLGGTVSSLGTLTSGTGTITFDSGAAQTVPALAYYNLIVSKTAGTATAGSGSLTVGGALTVSDGTFDTGTSTVTVTGATSLSDATPPATGSIALSTGVLDLNGACTVTGGASPVIVFSGTGRIDFGGATTLPASPTVWLTPSTGTIRYDRSDTNFTLSRNGATGYNHLVIRTTGLIVTADAAGATTVGGDLSVELGTFNVGTSTVTVGGNVAVDSTLQIGTGMLDVTSGSFDASGATVTFSGAGRLELGGAVTSLGTFTASTGTVEFKDTSSDRSAPAVTYYTVEITPGAPRTVSVAGSFAIGGTLTVSAGSTFSLGVYTITVTGNVTCPGTLAISTGTLDANSSFDASGGAVTFTGAGRLQLGGNPVSLGTFTASTGTVEYDDTGADRNVLVPSSNYANLEIDAGARTATAGGSFTLTGGLTVTSGTFQIGATTLVVPSGQTARVAGTLTASGAATVDVNGTLDATGGTISFTNGAGNASLQIGGPLTSLGTLSSGSFSTVTYDRSDADLTVSPQTYCNLTISMPGRTATISGTVVVNRALSVTTGILRISAPGDCSVAVTDQTATPDFSIAAAGGLTLAGNTGGAYLRMGPAATAVIDGAFLTSTASSVKPTLTRTGASTFACTLNGSVTIAGLNASWLTAAGLQITGSTANLIDIDDLIFTNCTAAGRFLNIQSAGGGIYSFTGFSFDASAQYSVTTTAGFSGTIDMSLFVGGGELTEDEPGVVSPGKIQWFGTTTWTGANSVNWSDGLNWDLGVPSPSMSAVIPNMVNDPTLDADGSCLSLNVTTGTLTINAARTLSVYGNATNSGSISMTAGRILLTGTQAQGVNIGSNTLKTLEISKTAGTVTLGGTLNVGTGGLAITQGTLDVNSRTMNLSGPVTFGGSGTRVLTASTGTITANGSFNGTGGTVTLSGAATLTLASSVVSLGTFSAASTSLVRFADTSANRTLPAGAYGRIRVDTTSRVVTVSGTATVAGLLEVLTGTLDLGSAASDTLDLSAGLTVSNGATLRATGAGAPGPSLRHYGTSVGTVAGTLQLAASGANYPRILFDSTGGLTVSGSFVTSQSGAGKAQVGKTPAGSGGFSFAVTGTVNVDGLTFGDAGVNGLDLDQPATWTLLQGVELTATAVGGTGIRIRASSLTKDVRDCTFAALAAGQYNVTAVDTTPASPNDVEITMLTWSGLGAGDNLDNDADAPPGVSTTTNAVVNSGDTLIPVVSTAGFPAAPATLRIENEVVTYSAVGAGDFTVGSVGAHAFGSAVVPADDGISDSPAGGAIVKWTQETNTTVQGEPQLFVTPAYDANTGAWYATYVASRLPAADKIYVLNQYGVSLYDYTLAPATDQVTGLPWWDTNPVGGEHLVFFGTSDGKLYALRDTGAALVLWNGWTTNPIDVGPGVHSVDSSVIAFATGDNVYHMFFGGRQSGDDGIFNFTFDYDDMPGVPTQFFFTGAPTNTVASAPAVDTLSSPWRLFIGANQAAIGVSPGVYGVKVQSSTSPYASKVTDNNVNAPIALGGAGAIFVGSQGTSFYVLYGRDPATLPDINVANGFAGYSWPYTTSGAVTTLADIFSGGVRFGDETGRVYNIGFSGTDLRPPLLVDGGTPIHSAGYVNGTKYYIGNDAGKLFVIDLVPNPMRVVHTYQLAGSSDRITDVAIDYVGSDTMIYVGSSNGSVYVVNRGPE